MSRGRTSTHPQAVVTLRLKHWLEVDGRFAIGDGGVELLRAIAIHGTLARASSEVGWSYRHAWGYIRRAESALATRLTQPRSGKGAARGLELTAPARRLLRQFPSGAKTRRFPKLS
jgi:molybdate transport system regulatory protein